MLQRDPPEQLGERAAKRRVSHAYITYTYICDRAHILTPHL